MKVSHFSVSIPEGVENSEGYVRVRHGTRYTILLCNSSVDRCDAEVKIDTTIVGLWRLEAESSIKLERPVHDTGCFTFFRVGTPEAISAGIKEGHGNGVLSVKFKPEKVASQSLFSAARPGCTGLTGESEQEFFDAEEIEYDDHAHVTINLRLICDEDAPRPLSPSSNRVPPPVGGGEAECAMLNQPSEMTPERSPGHSELFRKEGRNIREEEKGGRSEKAEVGQKDQGKKDGGWVVKKRYVSLGCQGLALAIIWSSDLSLMVKMIGSVIAVTLLRAVFGEL